MRPEDNVLFLCTRQAFNDAHLTTLLHFCHVELVRWELVFAEALEHGVAPLIHVNLQLAIREGLTIPADIQHQFTRTYFHSIAMTEKRAKKLENALEFLRTKSIDVMLIKGGALGLLVYAEPWYTTPGDIDLVVRPRQEALTEHDVSEIDRYFYGREIECDFFSHHDIVINGLLPVDFDRIWQDAARIPFRNETLFVMAPEDMLISLCINSCRKRFLRLKGLCDIAETVNAYPTMNWGTLVSKAQAYDCHNIIYAALLATEQTLGCAFPNRVLTDLNVSPMRAKLIQQLVQRMALSDYSSIKTSTKLFDRGVGWSATLPFTTYQWYQIYRKFTFIWRTRTNARAFAPLNPVESKSSIAS